MIRKNRSAAPARKARLSPEASAKAGSGGRLPEWIAECAGSAPRALLSGASSLLIENCGMVTAFRPEEIVLATVMGPLRVEGAGLTIHDMRKNAVCIRGRIRAVLLPDTGDDSHA